MLSIRENGEIKFGQIIAFSYFTTSLRGICTLDYKQGTKQNCNSRTDCGARDSEGKRGKAPVWRRTSEESSVTCMQNDTGR